MLNDPRYSTMQRTACAVVPMLLAALLGHAAAASADEVTSKGTALTGKITGLSGAGITFEPAYGKGSLAIKWENIDNLKSEGPFQVLYGDGLESDAPLQGFSNGQLMVGETAAAATPVDIKAIQSGVPIGPGGPSFADRMRSTWRYWDGNFDVGINVQQATTNTTGFLVGMQTTRTKDPTRFTLGASYRYATQKKRGEEKTTTQDQALGLIRGEYDFAPRFYGFASGDAMYDGIQKLSIRAVPKAGVGYVVWERQLEEDTRDFLQVEAGPSYVYERYFGGANRDYFAVAFGALAGYYLPYGAHFDGRVDYLPAVDDFTGKYLLRSEAGLTFPLYASLAAKFSLLDEYNNKPAPDASHNSLYLTLGFSLLW